LVIVPPTVDAWRGAALADVSYVVVTAGTAIRPCPGEGGSLAAVAHSWTPWPPATAAHGFHLLLKIAGA
jgi:hypothetical protein